MARYRRHPATAAGPDKAELKPLEGVGVGLAPCRSRSGGGDSERESGRWTREQHHGGESIATFTPS